MRSSRNLSLVIRKASTFDLPSLAKAEVLWYILVMVMKKISLLLAFLLLIALSPGTEVFAESPKAPPFAMLSFKGKRFTQNDLIGKATLVIFWASWCGTCQHELPEAQRLQETMAGKPFQIISIGFRDSEDNIRAYVREHPQVFSFPVFFDKKDRVSEAFGARETPTLFLFNKEGELVVRYRGGGMFEHPKFKETLEALL